MKNKFFQRKLALAKKYNNHIRKSKIDSKLGLRVYRCYSPGFVSDYTWWDDLSFELGSQMVFVTFLHPRYEFNNWVYNENIRLNAELYEKFISEFKQDVRNEYRRVGKSRKALRAVIHASSDERKSCWATIKESLGELRKSTEYRQHCYFNITQTKYGRDVVVCAPLEIKSEQDLVAIKQLVIDTINDRGSFERKFSTYSYGSEEWANEAPLRE